MKENIENKYVKLEVKLDNLKDDLKKDISDLREDKTIIQLSSNIPNESIKHFIQKDALFKKIEDIFSKSNKYVIISGYAGSGKKTLASKYGHKQKDENNKIVRWFNAESKELLSVSKYNGLRYFAYNFLTVNATDLRFSVSETRHWGT
ncbi:unnamed protein product [Didymodactylos carnosus]|uniref:Uncharacterized protein n=2 Tax=Didymodactylos carnosus TaxID=1234261 RepID=A0A814X8L3_9BILA|nr:unnamed protein product [Didymodactylos carnosus]CAF3976457.1 unnamed protein product [Didymodactylos carnosus]